MAKKAQQHPCICGCGKPAPLAKTTNRQRGHVVGQPTRFVEGHQHRVYRPEGPNYHDPQWFERTLQGGATRSRTRS